MTWLGTFSDQHASVRPEIPRRVSEELRALVHFGGSSAFLTTLPTPTELSRRTPFPPPATTTRRQPPSAKSTVCVQLAKPTRNFRAKLFAPPPAAEFRSAFTPEKED